MVHGGRALARLEDGRVALLEGALPGERVEATLAPVAGVLQGAVERVLEASPDRVEAPAHPGLDYGFIAYPRQLREKREVLTDAAHRSGVALPGGDPEALAVRASPHVWGYRNAVQPAVARGPGEGGATAEGAPREAGEEGGDAAIGLGYRRPRSGEIVELAEDPTANDGLRRAWSVLRSRGLPAGVLEVALRGNDAGEVLAAFVTDLPHRELLPVAHALVRDGLAGVAVAPWDARGRFRSGKARLSGAREVRQRYGRMEISISATAFAQVNPVATGELLEALEGIASGGEGAAELFAGSGVIGMHLAGRYGHVRAIEVSRESVARGRRDVERLGLENLTFERVDVRRVAVPDVELLVVDPPRAGLAKALRAAIDASPPRELIYVSCDVATWARDAADFASRGWKLTHVLPFDFQPHTHHLELLTRFER